MWRVYIRCKLIFPHLVTEYFKLLPAVSFLKLQRLQDTTSVKPGRGRIDPQRGQKSGSQLKASTCFIFFAILNWMESRRTHYPNRRLNTSLNSSPFHCDLKEPTLRVNSGRRSVLSVSIFNLWMVYIICSKNEGINLGRWTGFKRVPVRISNNNLWQVTSCSEGVIIITIIHRSGGE